MSIEAMKLALRRAFNLGQTYWQQADSEYSSHWKKADVTKASFEQLVEETCQAIEQAQKQEPVGFDKTVLDEWTKEYKVEVAYWKAKHDELLRILKQNAEPWVQEPVGVVTGCAEHGEFFTAVFRSKTEVLVDTKIYTSQPQRQPLTYSEERDLMCKHHWLTSKTLRDAYRLGLRDAEAAHGITKE